MASLANKLPKPCQVLIYLTFAAERNCQKFKRVHFKHQTSFHRLYSGLRPNFYSWVKQWQVCMSRLKARCPGLTSGAQTAAQCPAATRFLPLTSWAVLGSAGCWAPLSPSPATTQLHPLEYVPETDHTVCRDAQPSTSSFSSVFLMVFLILNDRLTFLLQTSSFEQQHLDWKFQRSGL